ncbi:MAG: flagellar biosynthetic protein FliR, partial [Pseudomonadota bacterium]
MDGLDGLALYDNLRPFLQLFVLSTSRAFGVTLLFLAFAWGRLSSGVLRMSFAIALAFPIAVPFYGNAEVVLERLEAPFIIIVIKEMFLGALLGFLASIPFALVLSAGNIIDSYRGAFIGTPDPAGAPTTPYAQLFMIVALWIFAALGGFWIMTDVIYGTYAVWPLFTLLPELTGAGLSALVGLFRSMVVGALVVAGPILFLMMLSVVCMIIYVYIRDNGRRGTRLDREDCERQIDSLRRQIREVENEREDADSSLPPGVESLELRLRDCERLV